jgi:hypothetical protein
MQQRSFEFVMPGLVPGTTPFFLHFVNKQGVDGRDKPGHDVERLSANARLEYPPDTSKYLHHTLNICA